MKKEFTGVGDKIVVDGDNLFIKKTPVKENCYLPHIEWIKLGKVNLQGRGILYLYTDSQAHLGPVFKKNQYNDAKEMYEFLLPYMERLVFNNDEEKLTIYNKGNDEPLEKPINKVNVSNPRTFLNYQDINSYEVICDKETINTQAMQNAASGKYVAGNAGTLAGMLSSLNDGEYITKLQIKINVNNMDNPCVYVKYITRKLKKDSEMAKDLIKMCDRDIARLEIICNKKEQNIVKTANDPYEEIKKLKELLDMGILSQDEFDKKKKELLNL